MESPRFENQSDAEDYIRELESRKQVNSDELGQLIKKQSGQTDWDVSPERLAEIILSKYRVVEK
jgi:hypothetical protein